MKALKRIGLLAAVMVVASLIPAGTAQAGRWGRSGVNVWVGPGGFGYSAGYGGYYGGYGGYGYRSYYRPYYTPYYYGYPSYNYSYPSYGYYPRPYNGGYYYSPYYGW